MDPRARRASSLRDARLDDFAADAAGQGWSDIGTVTLGTGFAGTMAGLVVVHVAAAVADVVIIPEAPLLPIAPLATAVVLALFGVLHLRRPLAGAALRTMLGLAFALTTADVAMHLVVGLDPMYAVYLTLAMVGAGAMLPDLGWLLVCDALAAIAVVVVAVPNLADTHAQQALAATTFAIAVAHVLQRHARRGRRRLQVLATALARSAMIDPLTGLPNRQGLAEGLQQMLDVHGTGRTGGRSLAVLCFDIDGFKAINDDLGHATGDAVLIEVAERLRELVREGDVVTRLGGDEFALVLADVAPEDAVPVAVRARLRLRGIAGVLEMPWSVSVGMVCGDVSTVVGVEDMLRRADLNMYVDKRARRAATAEPENPGDSRDGVPTEA